MYTNLAISTYTYLHSPVGSVDWLWTGYIFTPHAATDSQLFNRLENNMNYGTLVVDRCAVTFGTARRILGGVAARPDPSSLYQM